MHAIRCVHITFSKLRIIYPLLFVQNDDYNFDMVDSVVVSVSNISYVSHYDDVCLFIINCEFAKYFIEAPNPLFSS